MTKSMPPIRGALLLAAFLAVSLAYVGYRGISDTADIWNVPGTDFRTFYQAGGLLISSHRAALYGGPAIQDLPEKFINVPGNFFNPPLFAAIYTPLTIFSMAAAKVVNLIVVITASLGLIWVCRHWSRRPLDLLFFGLAIASFWPLYTSIQVGQPSMLIALVTCVAFLNLDRGLLGPAGGWISALVLKPSLAVAHCGFVLFRGNRSTWAQFAIGAFLIGLVPFLWIGLDSIDHFRSLLGASRNDSFTVFGNITAGAAYMFNWNGFVARLTLADPRPALVFPLYLLSAALALKVWSHEHVLEGWLAAALVTNLALPHMVYYDTLMLLAPSFALAAQRRQPMLLALLAVTHLCINVSMWQVVHNGFEIGHRLGYALILATPAMFLLLTYLAFEPEIAKVTQRRRLEVATAA